MSSDHPSGPEQVDAAKARRSLRNGLITLVLAGALIVGLLLAVPGLKGVATTVSNMKAGHAPPAGTSALWVLAGMIT